MRNEENDCIRYLMKEMDPSEELLMERAMMEDEDLLIEVESMRQTLQKLDKLPEVKPSSEVCGAILEKAAEHAEKKRTSDNVLKPLYKYAVAASLMLTVTAGGAWLFIGSEEGRSTQPTISSMSHAKEQPAGMKFSESNAQTSASQSKKVDPWVDRNNILRFEDQFSNQSAQFQSILKTSAGKLQLIENPSVSGGRVNSIQLTGSQN